MTTRELINLLSVYPDDYLIKVEMFEGDELEESLVEADVTRLYVANLGRKVIFLQVG